MRFAITPLGAAGGRTVDQVVRDIVRYLDKPRPTPHRSASRQAGGPETYYTDGSAEAGRWLGGGAAAIGLEGAVEREDFRRVLAGRAPRTGERLIGASGSAGRVPTLGVGTATQFLVGELMYDEHDAAAALGLEADEFSRLVDAGIRTAFGRLLTALTGAPMMREDPSGSFVVPFIDANGRRWIRDSELTRVQEARAAGPDPEMIRASGSPDDLFTIEDAARFAGVSSRYLRRLARRYETDRQAIDSRRLAAEPVGKAYVVAQRGTRGRWFVRRDDLAEFLLHRTAPAVRVGFDLTLTTEKSLGVLALLGPPAVRDRVLTAIQAGNDTGLAWWEQRAAVARVAGKPAPTQGWTVGSFRHLTSRALDPFPHHHNVVANAVTTLAGDRRTLDARLLYRHAVAASALATAEMRYWLTALLGVQWRRSASGGWEIAGIPDEILREFSRRRSEIDDALAELEAVIGRASSIEEVQQVIAATRPPKRQADAADLHADWWKRARRLGFGPEDLSRCWNRTAAPAVPWDRIEAFAELASASGITATSSVFTRGDVIAALVDMPVEPGVDEPLLLPAACIEELADAFLTSGHVVRLRSGRRLRGLGDEPVFTTREMLGVQQRIVDRYQRGLRAQTGSVEPPPRGGLTAEQAALVRSFCTSGIRVQCAIGRAGAGKTTAMRAAADAWKAAGYRVLGAAVKGEAARQLGASAGIAAETLAWYLVHDDPGRSPLDARTVLIVDEASTISDRELDHLLQLAEVSGATVRLIGDPAQHGAVGAGGMFRVLCELHPARTPELTAHQRLQHASDQAAADALREGHIDVALRELAEAGHLHLAADDVHLYTELLTRWWAGRQAGTPHPLVERSNHRRRQLNRLARQVLRAHGAIGSAELVASGDRGFSIGDEVIARRGDRHLHPPGNPASYVRNGARGRVVQLVAGDTTAGDLLVVDFEDLGRIEIPRSFFDHHPGPGRRLDSGIDHAYAVTSYAVQGATFEESTARIDENTTRAEAYVDVTRGRRANHLYATRAQDPLDGERLPKAPPLPLDVSLGIRLKASGHEVTAWEVGVEDSKLPAPPPLSLA